MIDACFLSSFAGLAIYTSPSAYILDGSSEISTGIGGDDRRSAEKAFGEYIGKKHRPEWHNSHSSEILVADVLSYYGQHKAPQLAHPELVGYHMTPLLKSGLERHAGRLAVKRAATTRRNEWLENLEGPSKPEQRVVSLRR